MKCSIYEMYRLKIINFTLTYNSRLINSQNNYWYQSLLLITLFKPTNYKHDIKLKLDKLNTY